MGGRESGPTVNCRLRAVSAFLTPGTRRLTPYFPSPVSLTPHPESLVTYFIPFQPTLPEAQENHGRGAIDQSCRKSRIRRQIVAIGQLVPLMVVSIGEWLAIHHEIQSRVGADCAVWQNGVKFFQQSLSGRWRDFRLVRWPRVRLERCGCSR